MLIDKLIELYFKQPKVLFEHLFASYHQLVEEIIPYGLTKDTNYFYENVDKNIIYLHLVLMSIFGLIIFLVTSVLLYLLSM